MLPIDDPLRLEAALGKRRASSLDTEDGSKRHRSPSPRDEEDDDVGEENGVVGDRDAGPKFERFVPGKTNLANRAGDTASRNNNNAENRQTNNDDENVRPPSATGALPPVVITTARQSSVNPALFSHLHGIEFPVRARIAAPSSVAAPPSLADAPLPPGRAFSDLALVSSFTFDCVGGSLDWIYQMKVSSSPIGRDTSKTSDVWPRPVVLPTYELQNPASPYVMSQALSYLTAWTERENEEDDVMDEAPRFFYVLDEATGAAALVMRDSAILLNSTLFLRRHLRRLGVRFEAPLSPTLDRRESDRLNEELELKAYRQAVEGELASSFVLRSSSAPSAEEERAHLVFPDPLDVRGLREVLANCVRPPSTTTTTTTSATSPLPPDATYYYSPRIVAPITFPGCEVIVNRLSPPARGTRNAPASETSAEASAPRHFWTSQMRRVNTGPTAAASTSVLLFPQQMKAAIAAIEANVLRFATTEVDEEDEDDDAVGEENGEDKKNTTERLPRNAPSLNVTLARLSFLRDLSKVLPHVDSAKRRKNKETV